MFIPGLDLGIRTVDTVWYLVLQVVAIREALATTTRQASTILVASIAVMLLPVAVFSFLLVVGT